MITFDRFQGGSMDSLDTHKSKYYQNTFNDCLEWTRNLKGNIVDPFARNCTWGDLTNDINQETKAMYHLDALEFLKMIKSESAKIVLFDPPFSPRQEKRYENGTNNLYSSDSNKISKLNQEVFRILKPQGVMLKLGYNSSRPNKSMNLIQMRIVNFGGSRNDVICSVWQKNQHTLTELIQ